MVTTRSTTLTRATAALCVGLTLGAPLRVLAQALPSAGSVQKIDVNVNRFIGQAADLSSTLISQVDAAKKAADAAKTSADALSGFDSTIEKLTALKNVLKYVGYATFIVDFALSFVPAQDKTFELLQTTDHRVSLLGAQLADAVANIENHADLVTAVNSIRDDANGFSATLLAMDQYLRDKSANGSAPLSPLSAYFVGMNRDSAAVPAGRVAGYCSSFLTQSNIFRAMSDATYGSVPYVTQLGTTMLLLLSQFQRSETYDTYATNAAFLTEWPDDAARKAAAAQAMLDVFGPYFDTCTGAFSDELTRLGTDEAILAYVTNVYNDPKAAGSPGDANYPQTIGTYLKRNFPNKDWSIISYDDVSGYDNHTWTNYDGTASASFRAATNNAKKAVLITWADPAPFASSDDRWTGCRNGFGAPRSIIYYQAFHWASLDDALTANCPSMVRDPSGLPPPALSFYWLGNPETVKNLEAWSSNDDRVLSVLSYPGATCKAAVFLGDQDYCPPYSVAMLARPRFTGQEFHPWPSLDQRLNVDTLVPTTSVTPSEDVFAHWTFEPAQGKYFRIKNDPLVVFYLNVEHQTGTVEFSPILPNWWSAEWELVPLTKISPLKGTLPEYKFTAAVRNRWTGQVLSFAGGAPRLANAANDDNQKWVLPGMKWPSEITDPLPQ